METPIEMKLLEDLKHILIVKQTSVLHTILPSPVSLSNRQANKENTSILQTAILLFKAGL